MRAEDIVKAIKFLKPTAEFSLTDNDYSTIKWDVLEGDAPTFAELEKALIAAQAKEVKENAAAEAKRQAILDRLGITAEEAALLLK
jgi:hypothetical protein